MIIINLPFMLSLYAWTTAETNAVVRELTEVANRQLEWEAMKLGDDDMVLPPTPPANAFNDLFVSERVSNLPYWGQWTPADRKAAFTNFVEEIPAGTASRYGASMMDALRFCFRKDYTNSLGLAMAILQSPVASADCKIEAAIAFSSIAPPSEDRNNFAFGIVTNRVTFSNKYVRAKWLCSQDRWVVPAMFSGMCDALSRDYDAGHTNIAQSGAAILYRNLQEQYCAKGLDEMMVKVYPTYVISSNRLAIACAAIDSGEIDVGVKGYFIDVTNQLLNASQPLPVVDGL